MNKTTVAKDPAGKKMVVNRSFSAPLPQVWQAWTDSSILDQWWAPHPYKANTKTMNFTEGGHWLYAMTGPDDFKSWARFNFERITTEKSFEGDDLFCDENGDADKNFSPMHWVTTFNSTENGTDVQVEVTCDSEETLAKVVEMGFIEGFTASHDQLEALLAK
jgi:uncharacterized protein YndB with AHSA1/START domain